MRRTTVAARLALAAILILDMTSRCLCLHDVTGFGTSRVTLGMDAGNKGGVHFGRTDALPSKDNAQTPRQTEYESEGMLGLVGTFGKQGEKFDSQKRYLRFGKRRASQLHTTVSTDTLLTRQAQVQPVPSRKPMNSPETAQAPQAALKLLGNPDWKFSLNPSASTTEASLTAGLLKAESNPPGTKAKRYLRFGRQRNKEENGRQSLQLENLPINESNGVSLSAVNLGLPSKKMRSVSEFNDGGSRMNSLPIDHDAVKKIHPKRYEKVMRSGLMSMQLFDSDSSSKVSEAPVLQIANQVPMGSLSDAVKRYLRFG